MDDMFIGKNFKGTKLYTQKISDEWDRESVAVMYEQFLRYSINEYDLKPLPGGSSDIGDTK